MSEQADFLLSVAATSVVFLTGLAVIWHYRR